MSKTRLLAYRTVLIVAVAAIVAQNTCPHKWTGKIFPLAGSNAYCMKHHAADTGKGKVGAASAGGYAETAKTLPLFYMTAEETHADEQLKLYRATIFEDRQSYVYFSRPADKPPEAYPKYA